MAYKSYFQLSYIIFVKFFNCKSSTMDICSNKNRAQPHSPTSRLLKEIQSLDAFLPPNRQSQGKAFDMIELFQEIPKENYSIEDIEDQIIGDDSLFGDRITNDCPLKINAENSYHPNEKINKSAQNNSHYNAYPSKNNKNNSIISSQKPVFVNKTVSMRQKTNQNINSSNIYRPQKRNSISPTLNEMKNSKENSKKTQYTRIATQPNAHQLFELYLEDESMRNKDGKKSKYCSGSDMGSLECTFKPKILKRSYELAKNIKNIVQRSSIQPEQKHKRIPYKELPKNLPKSSIQRIQQLSKPRQTQKPAQHIAYHPPQIKPSLSKKSLSSSTLDIAARNKIWMEQKQAKIQRLRRQEEEEKIRKEQCTHTPSILQYKGKSNVYISNFGKEGIINYFERMAPANKRSSISNLSKDNILMHKDSSTTKQSTSTITKKQTYSEAVKKLHSKIMKMNIG